MIRLLSISLLLLAGCSSGKKTETAKPAPKVASAKVVQPEAPPKARLVPIAARVVSVVPDLRFVVIDFTNSRQPILEQRLNVYRVGQKVGEIKVSGPYRNTTVAADLMAGEARYGDEVKAD